MKLGPPPLSFCRSANRFSWSDFLWGFEREIFSWKDAIAFATLRVGERSDPTTEELELASLEKDDAGIVNDIVRRLASTENHEPNGVERKWRFLLLKWLFENRGRVDDPLGDIEQIYADFGYPRELENFVRYMPPSDGYDPGLHTAAENHARLIAEWEHFLDGERVAFAQQ